MSKIHKYWYQGHPKITALALFAKLITKITYNT